MLDPLFTLQATLATVLGVALLATTVFAFVDALRHREDAYRAADKMTKGRWLLITGLAAAFGLLVLRNPLSLFGIIAIVAAGVYLADVRPALQEVESRRGGGGRSSRPW